MINFEISEFDSPDKQGSGKNMNPSTLKMLDLARSIARIPFVINSGYRTKQHNAKVGGIFNSSHTKGYAVDIQCSTSRARWVIFDALKEAGFNRIGISDGFIHVDNDPDKIKSVIWTY